MVLEKTLENPWDFKELKPVHPKRNQSWIVIGMTDTEAPILWPPDAKNWLIGKDPVGGKIEGRKRRGRQRMRFLDDIFDSIDMSLSKLQVIVKDREFWHPAVHGVTGVWCDLVTEQRFFFAFFSHIYYYITLSRVLRAISPFCLFILYVVLCIC